MKLSLEVVLEKLAETRAPFVYLYGQGEPGFSGVRLCSASTPPVDTGLLYVAELTSLLSLPPEQLEGHTFCCFGSRSDFHTLQDYQSCNLLYFFQDPDPAACFNDLQVLFSRFWKWEAAMDRLILKKAELQELVDCSDWLIDTPVYLWDANYTIVAHSRDKHRDHPLLLELEQRGRIPEHIVDMHVHTKDGIMYNTEKYSTMQLLYPPNLSGAQFALRIFHSGKKSVLVLCSYFVGCTATLGRMELLRLFADKIGEYIDTHYPKSQFRTLLYEPFIVELVEGSLRDEREIRERLEFIKLPYEMRYRIYYIEAPSYTASLINYLRHNCKAMLPFAKVIPYRKGVLILDQEGRENRDPDKVKQRLDTGNRALGKIGAVCGVSLSFPHLGLARMGYTQAMASYELGGRIQPGRIFHFYRNVYLYHLLDICNRSPDADLGLIALPGMEELERSDRESGNDNMKLLEIYVRNNRNITYTAREMHLHRNSVIYRLERIEQILRVPLSDPDAQLRVLVSLHIRRLLAARGEG